MLYRSRNKIKCQRKKGKDYCFTLHIGFIIVRLIVIFKNFNNTFKLILFFASPQSSTLQYLRYHYTSSFHLNHLQLSTIFQRTANLEAGIITPSSSRVTKKTFANCSREGINRERKLVSVVKSFPMARLRILEGHDYPSTGYVTEIRDNERPVGRSKDGHALLQAVTISPPFA